MKTFKKTIALALAASMMFSFAACTKKEPVPVDPTPVDPNPPIVDPKPTEPEPIPLPDFKISLEDFPIIDGATAMLPYYQEMASRVLGLSSEEARRHVLCNTTAQAYINLIEGKADMIFCAPPSEDQLKYAKSLGVELESKEVLNSGFVFFVNKSNPVNNLTKKQLYDIYAGKITNWKEVGGNDEEIIAYQRSEGSGSQSGLYEHLIDKLDVAQPPMEQKIGEMAMIVDAVSSYDNAKGAIGYSYYYYVTNMHYQEDVKLLSIDSVYPTSETISSGMYPFISKTAVWFNKNQADDSFVRKIADYCAGVGGYRLAEDLGYVPSKSSSYVIPAYKSVKESFKFTPSVTQNNLDIETVNEKTENDGYIQYIQISGLKDKTVQNGINNAILAEVEKLKNSEYQSGELGSAINKKSSGDLRYLSTYETCNVNDVLSLELWGTYYIETDTGYEYGTKVSTMNFDLKTGKQLKISDFFANKTDAMNYLNSKVWDAVNKNGDMEYIYMEFEGELMLAAPFTGIKEDQKFVVNGGNGTMTLVFDENTPEFYLPVELQTFTVPLQGYVDFEKFVAKDSLYESIFVNKRLLSRNDYFSRVYTETDYSKLIGDRPIYYWESYMDSEELGPSARTIANGNPEKVKALIERAINLYEDSKDLSDDLSLEVTASTDIIAAGNYNSVGEYYNCMLYHPHDGSYQDHNESKLRCYRRGSDEELLLVEVFKDGVDAREAIANALYKRFHDDKINQTGIGLDQPGLEAFLEAAVHDMSGFGISTSYFLFSYTNLDDIILRFLEVPESEFSEYKYMMQLLEYQFFGPDELDIFD